MKVKKRRSAGVYDEWKLIDRGSIVSFINESMKPKYKWISIGEQLDDFVNEIISSTQSLSFKKWRSLYWSKYIIDYSKPSTVNFWLVRGYSSDHANMMISNQAKMASDSFSKKVKKNPNDYRSINPTQIGYWVNKGYSITEAKDQVSKRQRTFSLELCIQKWGKDKGKAIFNDRQTKWLDSMNMSNGITWFDSDRNCRSLETFDSLVDLSSAYLNYSFLSEEVKNIYREIKNLEHKSKEDFWNWCTGLSIKTIFTLAKLKPIQEYLSLTKYQLIERYIDASDCTYKTSKWGRLYWYDDNFFQSTGEFAIGVYLSKNKIDYIMHKKYPLDDLLFYDFYLPVYDVYIEYCGRRGDVYDRKKSLTKDLPIIWSNDVSEIIDVLEHKYLLL